MIHSEKTIVLILLLYSTIVSGDLEATFGRCCALGANWARKEGVCSNFPSQVEEENPEDQEVCITTGLICCLRFYREEQCEVGKINAKNNINCTVAATIGGEYSKDCCNGCKMGLMAGNLGARCRMENFNFGFPWNEAYHQCCLDVSRNESDNEIDIEKHNIPSNEGTPLEELEIPDSENLCLRFIGQLCSHICVPTKQSYICKCRSGFVLSPDKKTCTQETREDRCQTHNPCDHLCRDTGISIECSCRQGYDLSSDQKTCNDIDECYLGTHKCLKSKQSCKNKIGSYLCVNYDGSSYTPISSINGINKGNLVESSRVYSTFGRRRTFGAQGFSEAAGPNKFLNQGICPPGFTFNIESRACDDVNECTVGPELCGSHIPCENTIGSYTCLQVVTGDCPNGFVFDMVVQTCIDVDECTSGSSNCNKGEFCLNTQGGYECQKSGSASDCPAGYKYNKKERTCEDVDECEEELHGCHPESEKCRNIVGAYECDLECGIGFKFLALPRSCVDVDECLEEKHSCKGDSEICINHIGSFQCKSRAGNNVLPDYYKPGSLSAINIPLKNVNIENPLVKDCPNGYAYDISTDECLDVDECRAEIHNCSTKTQSCINTLGEYICINKNLCLPGYQRNEESGKCEDIDECKEGMGKCMPGQICVNTIGTFECQVECREGFVYKPRDPAICVDIDECLANPCGSDLTCINTEGSYTCVERKIVCETGYENINGSCVDIDECVRNIYECQDENFICRNKLGGYECLNVSCSRGFHRDSINDDCKDINECEDIPCRVDEECINMPGYFQCRQHSQCLSGFRKISESSKCEDINECETGEHSCKIPDERCINSAGTYRCKPILPCPTGFKRDQNSFRCIDLDECADGIHMCHVGEKCINQYGRYKCIASASSCQAGYSYDFITRRCQDINECTKDNKCDLRKETCVNTIGSYSCRKKNMLCDFGYRFEENLVTCVDINECEEGIHLCSSNREECENLDGAYKCVKKSLSTTNIPRPVTQPTTEKPYFCDDGYSYDNTTRRCTDLNECQLGLHSCTPSQRCDNTHGSYTCTRIAGCGTGYTLNQNTGKCEDDDECVLNTNDCAQLGPKWSCVNTKGSFRCEKKLCPDNRILSSWGNCINITCTNGFKADNNTCVDVNECEESSDVCQLNERCINTVGSYRCLPKINCGRGYNMNDIGTQCIDLNECEDNTHKCEGGQICINRPGGYMCQCQKGYRLDRTRKCQDVNECEEYYQSICGYNADCLNTLGSYECTCKSGFEKIPDGSSCSDIDECVTTQNICQQKCTNNWGSYFCSCNPGYKLRSDNRTCSDIDECEEIRGKGKLCLGLCVNTPGTFRCSCPQGYRLDSDKRTCKDINECEVVGVCRMPDEICVNTRGSHKCEVIRCPDNYIRDPTQRNRCKKQIVCVDDDIECRRLPLMYSYSFLPLASNMTLRAQREIELFTMKGPVWSSANVQFELELNSVHPRDDVPPATRTHFKLNRTAFNQVVLVLVKPLFGPQDVTLSLSMKLYHNGYYEGSAISQLALFVSQYDF